VIRNFINKFFRFFVGTENIQTKSKPEVLPEKKHIPQEAIFCKLKKTFYVFFKIHTANASQIKKPSDTVIMITILIPCFIVLLSTFPVQVMAEVEICNALGVDSFSLSKGIEQKTVAANVNTGLIENFPKFIACVIKSFNSISFFGDDMVNKKNDQRDNNCG